jgi:xylulose-5-phosphate/fructose-6-phosphate phosphoketolase
VRGYKEEGTTTTPFDMVMLNDLDRYHLVIDVIDRVPFLQSKCATLRQQMVDKRITARGYTREHGDDIPEVRDWIWPGSRGARADTNVGATVTTGGDNE